MLLAVVLHVRGVSSAGSLEPFYRLRLLGFFGGKAQWALCLWVSPRRVEGSAAAACSKCWQRCCHVVSTVLVEWSAAKCGCLPPFVALVSSQMSHCV
jgi:hypothetical protein